MRARWYDPTTARWLSKDLVWDGTNRYAFVGNHFGTHVDYKGLEGKPHWWNDGPAGYVNPSAWGAPLGNWFGDTASSVYYFDATSNKQLREQAIRDRAQNINACKDPQKHQKLDPFGELLAQPED